MKRFKLCIILGLVLLLASGALFLSIIRSQATSVIAAPSASASVAKVAAANAISGDPTHLDIPSLGMSLDITPGVYNARTKTWTLTLNKVQYATITPKPNNINGNTFLYGHYRSEVFARLHTIPSGAQAVVTTSNGHTFYYQLAGVQTVDPTDSAAVFRPTAQPVLTIQTCTGLFFQHRQLFTFNFQKVV